MQAQRDMWDHLIQISSMDSPMQPSPMLMKIVQYQVMCTCRMEAQLLGDRRNKLCIALSSTEAEYVALSEASREAMWLRHLFGELGFIQKEPILLLGDNDGSIAMAKNPEFHKRTKHVDIRWHWVRELVGDGLINIVDCRDPQQTADILTKQLPRPKFVRHVNELGLSLV